MISSISSSVSAVKALSKKMSVTANNVANVNTDNFKKSRTTLNEGQSGSVVGNGQRSRHSRSTQRQHG